jgi:hypothetical protein
LLSSTPEVCVNAYHSSPRGGSDFRSDSNRAIGPRKSGRVASTPFSPARQPAGTGLPPKGYRRSEQPAARRRAKGSRPSWRHLIMLALHRDFTWGREPELGERGAPWSPPAEIVELPPSNFGSHRAPANTRKVLSDCQNAVQQKFHTWITRNCASAPCPAIGAQGLRNWAAQLHHGDQSRCCSQRRDCFPV